MVYEFVQLSQVQDIAEEQEQIIRGFLTKAVNNTYVRNYRALTSSTDQAHENKDFEYRLLFCLDNDLISFLKRKSTGNESTEDKSYFEFGRAGSRTFNVRSKLLL